MLLNRGHPFREHGTQEAIDERAKQGGRHTKAQRRREAGSAIRRLQRERAAERPTHEPQQSIGHYFRRTEPQAMNASMQFFLHYQDGSGL